MIARNDSNAFGSRTKLSIRNFLNLVNVKVVSESCKMIIKKILLSIGILGFKILSIRSEFRASKGI